VKRLAILAAALAGLCAAAAHAAPPGASAPAERFVLSGVVAYDDGDGKAWLREPSLTQNKVVIVRRGQKVGPWTVTRILSNQVELSGPSGTIKIPLSNAGGGRAVASSGATVSREPSGEAPGAPMNKTIEISRDDPRRREAIANLFGTAGQAGNGQQAGSGQQASPEKATALPTLSATGRASAPMDTTISIPAGDARQRDAIRQLFGGR